MFFSCSPGAGLMGFVGDHLGRGIQLGIDFSDHLIEVPGFFLFFFSCSPVGLFSEEAVKQTNKQIPHLLDAA